MKKISITLATCLLAGMSFVGCKSNKTEETEYSTADSMSMNAEPSDTSMSGSMNGTGTNGTAGTNSGMNSGGAGTGTNGSASTNSGTNANGTATGNDGKSNNNMNNSGPEPVGTGRGGTGSANGGKGTGNATDNQGR
ncbi:MAG: hypothetical protein JWN78_3228 [Bacteroidota bacterium]|nr:hypothetical protein [Bacteroidota bacterium]